MRLVLVRFRTLPELVNQCQKCLYFNEHQLPMFHRALLSCSFSIQKLRQTAPLSATRSVSIWPICAKDAISRYHHIATRACPMQEEGPAFSHLDQNQVVATKAPPLVLETQPQRRVPCNLYTPVPCLLGPWRWGGPCKGSIPLQFQSFTVVVLYHFIRSGIFDLPCAKQRRTLFRRWKPRAYRCWFG